MPAGSFLAAAAVAAAFVFAAAGRPAAGAGDRPPTMDDMRFGRLLLEAGRLEDARAFIEQARPGDEDEAIARLLLLGRVEMQLGLPREAARRFEAILARRPQLTHVRLELATAYYEARRDDKARHHFETALADRLPPSVEAKVRGFLDRIDSRRRWSGALSFALAPESNPARGAEQESVRIGGAPFRLDSDARAASGTGAVLWGGGSFNPVLRDGVRATFAVTGAVKLFRRTKWNDVSIGGDAGLVRSFDRSSLAGGLRAGQRWLGNEGYSRQLGPWIRGSLRLSGTTRAGVTSDLAWINHDGRPERDGWRWEARPRLFHALSARSSVEAGLEIEVVTARTQRFASRLLGLGLTFAHAFEGGLSVSPGIAAYRRRYGGPDPLFDDTRNDATLELSLKVLHRSLQYRGLAPHVEYRFETTRSSIPIHSHRNHAVLLGISREF